MSASKKRGRLLSLGHLFDGVWNVEKITNSLPFHFLMRIEVCGKKFFLQIVPYREWLLVFLRFGWGHRVPGRVEWWRGSDRGRGQGRIRKRLMVREGCGEIFLEGRWIFDIQRACRENTILRVCLLEYGRSCPDCQWLGQLPTAPRVFTQPDR